MARSVTGWRAKYIMDRPKIASAAPALTPEQKAAARARQEEFLRSMAPAWGVPPEEVDAWIERTAA